MIQTGPQDLLRLPIELLDEVRRGGPPTVVLARLLRGAVAVEILIMAPIRLHNLLTLRLGHELLPGPRGALTLALAAEQTKNGEPFEAALPACTARMVMLYFERYQPLLTRVASPWLFPNRAGEGPMAAENLRLQIQKLARERAGVALHPHLFRHIAVKLMLTRHPGAYGRARLILGHRSVKTTETFYAGTETRAAVELYGAEVLKARQSPPCRVSSEEVSMSSAPFRPTTWKPGQRIAWPVEQWPDGDGAAWSRARRVGSLLEEDGLAANWRPATVRTAVSIYGRFLAFLDREGLLAANLDPADRLTPAVLERYVEVCGPCVRR